MKENNNDDNNKNDNDNSNNNNDNVNLSGMRVRGRIVTLSELNKLNIMIVSNLLLQHYINK